MGKPGSPESPGNDKSINEGNNRGRETNSGQTDLVSTRASKELGIPLDESFFLLEALEKYNIKVPKAAGPLVRDFMHRAVRGSSGALPMGCQAEKCHVLHKCPLHKAGLDLPTGQECPVELGLMEAWISKLAHSQGITDPSDPGQAEQMELIYEITGLELNRWRIAQHLSDNPEVIKREVSGYSNQGAPVYDLKINPGLASMERLSKMSLKIREHLLATPKAQAQVGKVSQDKATRASELAEQARKKALERLYGEIKDVE